MCAGEGECVRMGVSECEGERLSGTVRGCECVRGVWTSVCGYRLVNEGECEV